MTRPISFLAATAAIAIAVAAPASAEAPADAAGSQVQGQLAQGGPYYGSTYGRPYGAPPPYAAYPPYGAVSPGTVRLRLIARGYYGIHAIRYVPHGPGRWRRGGPGARFPGHYVAVARRLGATYRFFLNPFTGRPYARFRIY